MFAVSEIGVCLASLVADIDDLGQCDFSTTEGDLSDVADRKADNFDFKYLSNSNRSIVLFVKVHLVMHEISSICRCWK